MTGMREYSQAARTVVAGLRLLREHAKSAGLPVTTMDLIYHAESRIADEIPPWEEPEPAAGKPLTWSAVVPGDSVKAPNGQWYPVDSISRIGNALTVLLKAPTGALIRSTPPIASEVEVRRGATGQAVDIFRAGGLELETIKSEVAA